MGMDVYGIDPKTDTGEYFRANCWSWRPIMEALFESGACDHVDTENWNRMGENSGGGPRSEDICHRMADDLEAWMFEEFTQPVYSPDSLNFSDTQVTKETTEHGGHTFTTECNSSTMSPYFVHREHLEEFVGFLRECRGFEVW